MATEVLPIDAWDKPAYLFPGVLKTVAFDAAGGMYAVADKEVRYYANPSAPNAAFRCWRCRRGEPVRRLLAGSRKGRAA